jgi:drug/metabolite transporter (DMT)-like permease
MPDARRPRHWQVYAVAGLATLIWSINYIFAKWTLREFPPMLTSGLRTAIAAALMLPVYAWHIRREGAPRWTRRDRIAVATLGVIGVGLNQVFFVLGIDRTSVSHAGIIVALTPLMVLCFAALAGQERVRIAQLFGMVFAFAGVAILQAGSAPDRQSSIGGDLLVFCGISIFAMFTVAGKRAANHVGPIVLNTWAYIASAIALLPVTLWSSASFDYGRVSWSGWTSLLYMAAFSSVIGYLLYYYALTHIAASKVSTFSYLQPLLAMGLAMAFLGERPSASLLSGGALVLAGVFVAERA